MKNKTTTQRINPQTGPTTAPLHHISYYDLSDLRKDLLSKGWLDLDIDTLVGDEHANGTMTSLDHGFTVENDHIFDEEEVVLAQKLLAAGYPREFNLWVCW